MSEKELYRQLGRAVAARREQLGLTQAQVAAALGLTRASLANIESGRQRIMVHQLFRLAGALKQKTILDLVPATWIFEQPLETMAFEGSKLTSDEQLGVKQLIKTAFADDRSKKKPL